MGKSTELRPVLMKTVLTVLMKTLDSLFLYRGIIDTCDIPKLEEHLSRQRFGGDSRVLEVVCK